MRRAALIGVAVAGAVAAAALWLPTAHLPFSSSESGTPASAPAQPRADGAASEGRFSALPERAPIGKLRGELFAPPPPPPTPVAATQPPPPKPVTPSMPYRVAGIVTHDGVSKVVLLKGDAVLSVTPGEMLEGGYRVESISADSIVLFYVPLGVRERLPVISTIGVDADDAPLARTPSPRETASAGAGSRPAQLR